MNNLEITKIKAYDLRVLFLSCRKLYMYIDFEFWKKKFENKKKLYIIYGKKNSLFF